MVASERQGIVAEAERVLENIYRKFENVQDEHVGEILDQGDGARGNTDGAVSVGVCTWRAPKLRLPRNFSFDVVRRRSPEDESGGGKFTLVDINAWCPVSSDPLLFDSFEELEEIGEKIKEINNKNDTENDLVEFRVVQAEGEERRGRRAAEYSAMPLELAELASGKMDSDELLRMVQRVEGQQRKAASTAAMGGA